MPREQEPLRGQEPEKQLPLPETPLSHRRALGRAMAEMRRNNTIRRYCVEHVQPAYLGGLQIEMQHEGVHYASDAGLDVEDMGVEMARNVSDDRMTKILKKASARNFSMMRIVTNFLRPEAIKVGNKVNNPEAAFRYADHVIDLGAQAEVYTERYAQKLKQELHQAGLKLAS